MDREISLLAAARQMNEDALAEIFEFYAPALYKYAFRLCQQAGMADQLVGEVFDRFVQELAAGQNPGVNLRTILFEKAYGILIREMTYSDYFLSTGRTVVSRRDQWSMEMGADDQRLFEALQRSLFLDLTEDQRHVVLLRFVEGFSLKETAAITGKKVNNVKVIQNRAVSALRKALDGPRTETHTITLLLRRLAQA